MSSRIVQMHVERAISMLVRIRKSFGSTGVRRGVEREVVHGLRGNHGKFPLDVGKMGLQPPVEKRVAGARIIEGVSIDSDIAYIIDDEFYKYIHGSRKQFVLF